MVVRIWRFFVNLHRGADIRTAWLLSPYRSRRVK